MKRRLISILSATLCCLSLTACSVTETEEYKQLQAAYDTLQANYTELEGNYNDLEVSNNATKASEDLLSDEIANLKEDYKELEDKYASLESKYVTLEFASSITSFVKYVNFDDDRVSGVTTAVYLDAGDYTLQCSQSNSYARVSISLLYTVSGVKLIEASPVTVFNEVITGGVSTTFNVQTSGFYNINLVDAALTSSDKNEVSVTLAKKYN